MGPEPVRHGARLRGRRGLRIIGSALLLVSCLVALVVGYHASFLGDDPAWLFDCDDTSCTDFWADARHHYRRTAVVCCVVAILGWATVGAGVEPRGPARGAARPARHRIALAAIIGGAAPVLSAPVGTIALAASLPMLAAAALGVHAAAAVLVWSVLHRDTSAPRAAWFVSGLAVSLGALAAACGAAATILVGIATSGLVPLPVPVVAVAGGAGAAYLVIRSSRRWLPHPPVLEVPRERPRTRSTGVAARGRARRGPWWSIVTACAIAVLGVWAARPVPAPDADAWMWESAPTQRPPTATEDPGSPGATAGAGDPIPSDPATSPPDERPTAPPAGWDTCAPADLEVTIGGWSAAMGESAAGIRATNGGSAPCVLTGRPLLEVTHDGRPLDLAVTPVPDYADTRASASPDGIGIRPGQTAVAMVLWQGEGAKDRGTSAQSANIRLDDHGESIPAAVEHAPGAGAAPFDVGPGGSVQTGRWGPDGGA